MGLPHLQRLRRGLALVEARGQRTDGCRLALFGAAGFSEALRERAAAESDVALVALEDLYSAG